MVSNVALKDPLLVTEALLQLFSGTTSLFIGECSFYTAWGEF
jgi:hypothetical protein